MKLLCVCKGMMLWTALVELDTELWGMKKGLREGKDFISRNCHPRNQIRPSYTLSVKQCISGDLQVKCASGEAVDRTIWQEMDISYHRHCTC